MVTQLKLLNKVYSQLAFGLKLSIGVNALQHIFQIQLHVFLYPRKRNFPISVSFLTNFLNVKNKELHSSPKTINLCQCPLVFYKTEITTYLSFFRFFTFVGIYLAVSLRQVFTCILYFVRFYLHFMLYF